MKYCVYCRTQLEDDMTYCTVCGKKQPEIREKPRRTVAEKLVVPVVIASGVISLLAIVAMVIYGFIQPDWAYPGKEQDQSAATGIMLNFSRKTIAPDESTPLEVWAMPPGTELDEITWISSDESVAVVSEGIVTAVAPGTADIIAEDPYGHSAKCRITVGADTGEDRLAEFGDLGTRLVSVSGSVPDGGSVISSNGYIMDNGYILTTSNVADNEENLFVTMPDGSSQGARLISNDIETNTAVLEIVDHIELSDDEENDISLEIGLASAATRPKAGDTLYVIGYQDSYSSEPVIKEVTYMEMIGQAGVLLYSVYSYGQSLMGGIVTDAYGKVYGINMADDISASISLILTSAEAERAVRMQIGKVNDDLTATETVDPSGRKNCFLDALSDHYGLDTSETAKQYDGVILKPVSEPEETYRQETETEPETETEAEPATESARTRAALEYLELVRETESDYTDIYSITGMKPIYVFADINGDDIPEMVYSRIINVTGTASTMADPSFEYTRAVQYMLVTYDDVDGVVRSFLPTVHIVINDRGEYLQTYTGRSYFYVFDNDDHLYVTDYGNISGAAFNVAEYEYVKHMGLNELASANTTNWGDSFSVTGTPGENMNRMMEDDNVYVSNTKLNDCRLLYSYMGESDFTAYSYEGAVDYLNNILK